MNKVKNKQPYIKALEQAREDIGEGSHGLRELKKHSVILEEGEFILTTVEKHGGYEGAGEEHWVVISILHNGEETLWELPGYYASHDGAYLEEENAFQVKGVEKMVIVYEPI